jgi:hypothetical protein
LGLFRRAHQTRDDPVELTFDLPQAPFDNAKTRELLSRHLISGGSEESPVFLERLSSLFLKRLIWSPASVRQL